MKLKALGLALAVASVATTANAATVIEKDGFTLTMKGDIEVQIIQAAGKDEKAKVDYDDAELKTKAAYAIGDMTAFGVMDFDLHKGATEETYVGLDFGSASVLVGNTDLPTDGFGNDATIEGSSSGTAFAKTSSDKQVQLSTSFGPVSLAIATEVEGTIDFDAFASTTVGPVSLGLAYQDAGKVDTYGVSAATSFGGLGVSLDFSDDDTNEVTHLAGTYSMFGFGYEIAEAAKVETKSYYLNATKSLNDNVSVFTEVSNTDAKDSDMGFLVGGKVTF